MVCIAWRCNQFQFHAPRSHSSWLSQWPAAPPEFKPHEVYSCTDSFLSCCPALETFLAWLCAVGRTAVIRRPADRRIFIHLPVSPPASAAHSSGSVELSESHRGFITTQSLIIHTQFKVSSGGISDDARRKFQKNVKPVVSFHVTWADMRTCLMLKKSMWKEGKDC